MTFTIKEKNDGVAPTGYETYLDRNGHDGRRFCDAEEQVSVTVVVISPSTSLDVFARAVITYTFAETNNSTDAPLTPHGRFAGEHHHG